MADAEILHMVTCVFNPSNYKSRYNRYFQFADYIAQFPNVKLYTIELSIKGQEFQVTNPDNPDHYRVETDTVLWYKENLLNYVIDKLPESAKKVAWVDCDVQWDNPDWVNLTLAALDYHPVVQMFATWQDLDKNDKPRFPPVRSFAKRWIEKSQKGNDNGPTGLAWAARRSVLRQLNGLIDWGIVGSGDYYMAFALTGRNRSDAMAHVKEDPSLAHITHVYDAVLNAWIKQADLCVKRNIGFIPSNLRHFFHGEKVDRGYNWRWTILAKHKYDPRKDISYRDDGLIYIKTDKPGMHEEIIDYFDTRREDTGITET